MTFSEAVTGFDATDISLNTTDTATASVSVSGSGADYTVTLDTAGDGTVGISLDGQSVQDGVGNTSGNAGPSATVSVDHTAPTVQSIVRADANPNNAASVQSRSRSRRT